VDVSQIGGGGAMAVAVRQLQATSEMQIAIMKDLAESQELMAELLESSGVGQHIDVTV